MAILIAQARFAVDDPPGVAAAPADRLKAHRQNDPREAANRLVANFGGAVIASDPISGDHDVVRIFEQRRTRKRCRRLAPPEAAWPI